MWIKGDNLLSNLCAFQFFFLFVAVDIASSAVFKVSSKSTIIAWFQMSGKNSLSPMSAMLAVGFLQILLSDRGGPLLSLVRVQFLVINRCWMLTSPFSTLLEKIARFFSFILIVWWITRIAFQLSNQPCIPSVSRTCPCCSSVQQYFSEGACVCVRENVGR